MKSKRLLSIVLALVMVVSTVLMSGCSNATNSDENSANSTSTRTITALNMYIITEDSTTTEAANKVQMEINRILLPEYKTMLKINYLTADEYWDVVEAALEETDPANSIDETGKFIGDLSNAEVVGTEKLGFNQLIDFIFDEETTDITLTKPQIDILVVDDYEKYYELANNEKLVSLNSYLDYDSKVLKTYIYPTLLSAARVGKETYGVPTNFGVNPGDYTYFVFNKDLLEKYGYEVKDLRVYSGPKFSEYLATIKANEPGVWPISGECHVAGAEYFENSFVSVASQLNYLANSCNPTFMEATHMSNLKAIASYRELGYFPAQEIPGAKYAIRIEKSPELFAEKEWTDETGTTYVRMLYDIPRVTIDEAFASAMCVSATSPVPDRAMEIITLFNTNPELANLLQYGIEGENYIYNTLDDTITMLDDSYSMNNLITGNTYIKYPPNNDKSYVETAKEANLNSAPSAFLGFNPQFDSKSEESQYECVKAVLQTAQEAVDNGADIETVRKSVSTELVALGYAYVGTTELGGIFGKVQQAQASQSKLIAQGFGVSQDIVTYNEPYGIFLQAAPKEEPEEEAVEGEETEAEGEESAAEGEETPAEEAAE